MSTELPTPTHRTPTHPIHRPPTPPVCLRTLSDEALLLRLQQILRDSRRIEADLVAHIAEVDERRLYLREACASMFSYCVERLHLSEPETGLRIQVARASRRYPALLDMLRAGRLHLSGMALLAPHLTERNWQAVLGRASHLPKRRIEELVAELAPRPDVATFVRRLPEACTRLPGIEGAKPLDQPAQHRPDDVLVGRIAATAAPDLRPPVLDSAEALVPNHRRGLPQFQPLAPSRYKVQFTASAALKEKLERLQVLMRAAVPDGDLAALIEEAVTEKIARMEAQRLGAAKRPRKTVGETDCRPGPRHVAAAVKRAVRARDGDRCAYVDEQGRRCTERNRLQFHHRFPHGFGGDRSVSNIAQLCWRHNRLEAEVDFGEAALAGRRRPCRSQ